MMKRLALTAALLMGLAPASALASAAWSLGPGGPNCTPTNVGGGTGTHADANMGNSMVCRPSAGTGPSVTLTAWARTGSGDHVWEEAALMDYGSGLGIINTEYDQSAGDTNDEYSPEHAADNLDRFEAFFIRSDGDPIQLTGLDFSWLVGGSDLTVVAFKGDSAPTGLAGVTKGGLDDLSGYTLVGQYQDIEKSGNTSTDFEGFTRYYTDLATHPTEGGSSVNLPSEGARSWLIAPGINPVTGEQYPHNSYDAFKLSWLGGHVVTPPPGTPPTAVPVPGTMLLLGLGLSALGWSRARIARR